MKQINETIFDEVGLKDLTPDEKHRMLGYITKTLDTRIGIRLATEAKKEQLVEFDKLSAQDNDENTLNWLEQSFPNFQFIYDEELNILKTELADMAPEILKAS
jgi:hypothetical protein